jgi:hypothetical protein
VNNEINLVLPQLKKVEGVESDIGRRLIIVYQVVHIICVNCLVNLLQRISIGLLTNTFKQVQFYWRVVNGIARCDHE